MSNQNWYYLCDLENGVALELMQLPESWGPIPDLNGLNDDALSNLTWAGFPDRGFLLEPSGMSAESIESAKQTGFIAARSILMKQRSELLARTDRLMLPDYWESYSDSKRTALLEYRRELRELIDTPDPINVVWPEEPADLRFCDMPLAHLEDADVPAETSTRQREALKLARAHSVARIVVSVGDKTFDGDEVSQTRMARAIIALEFAGQTSTTWVLATNEPATVTVDELKEALTKAGLAQTSVWVV